MDRARGFYPRRSGFESLALHQQVHYTQGIPTMNRTRTAALRAGRGPHPGRKLGGRLKKDQIVHGVASEWRIRPVFTKDWYNGHVEGTTAARVLVEGKALPATLRGPAHNFPQKPVSHPGKNQAMGRRNIRSTDSSSWPLLVGLRHLFGHQR